MDLGDTCSRHLYAGFDESNHGNFPEIMALASTYNHEYASLKRITRKNSSWFFNHPDSDLTYTFLSLNKSDFKIIGREKILGISITSLLSGIIDERTSGLTINIDGTESPKSKNFIKESISKVYQIPATAIQVVCAPHFDKKDPLVRYADFCAHKLFKEFSSEKLSQHSQQRYLFNYR